MAPLLVLGVLAVALLGIGIILENAIAVAGAIGVLGCQYVLALAMREETASVGAAVVGAALLLVSEMAHWSSELAAPLRAEGRVLRRRLLAIVLLVAASLAVGLGAAAVVGTTVSGSVLLTALGVGSVLAVIAIVTVLLWERREG